MLDSEIVLAGDEENDATNQFVDYLLENNSDDLLSVAVCQAALRERVESWNLAYEMTFTLIL